MTRRRAVGALILVIGGLVGMSLATIVAGEETAPALYVQMPVGKRTLDIWRRTSNRDLTLHWDDNNESVATRYIPNRVTIAELSGGKAISVTHYASSASAWAALHELYGVTLEQVRVALRRGGTAAPAAPTEDVTVPRASPEHR